MLESIDHKHKRSQAKINEALKQKSDFLKYKNSLIPERRMIA